MRLRNEGANASNRLSLLLKELVPPGVLFTPPLTFDLDPLLRRAGAVGTVDAFRYDAFQLTFCACLQERMRVEENLRTLNGGDGDPRHEFVQLLSASRELEAPQIFPVMRKNV